MNAKKRLSAFATRKAAVATAMESVGLNERKIQNDLRATMQDAGKLAADITTRAASQAAYDHLTNIPCGVLRESAYTPGHALRRAIPGAIGAYVEWDISEAIELCADILEDVNAHAEAAKLRDMAYQD